jgi:hypothetical protein
VEKYGRVAQATGDIMAHAHCMLDTKCYRHTHSLRNTYCLSTATLVARTRLSVMLYVHCLPYFVLAEWEIKALFVLIL